MCCVVCYKIKNLIKYFTFLLDLLFIPFSLVCLIKSMPQPGHEQITDRLSGHVEGEDCEGEETVYPPPSLDSRMAWDKFNVVQPGLRDIELDQSSGPVASRTRCGRDVWDGGDQLCPKQRRHQAGCSSADNGVTEPVAMKGDTATTSS